MLYSMAFFMYVYQFYGQILYMYIFLLSILLLSLITLLWLIFYLKKCYFNYKKNNIKILETIIYQSLKKRKNNIANLKNNAKTSKIKTFCKTNTFYIHLHKCKIYHKFNNFLHIKNQIYPERKILSALQKIIPIIREVEKRINYNKQAIAWVYCMFLFFNHKKIKPNITLLFFKK